jgi:hypothetical protein
MFGFHIIPEDHIIRNGEDGSDPRADTCNSEKVINGGKSYIIFIPGYKTKMN